ncbi:hypothetical protein O3M35_005394 [Rhynocoris fuscipes]|uniref:Chitin-binding type-2 domain-containing protein n=1 Tax=Rhynocoris fuscipes TaxID=488301 RepID=A0AAW1DNY7_9HEMI
MAYNNKSVLFCMICFISTGWILAKEEQCSEAGIFPGSSKREFIVCTPSGPDGKQLIRTKQTCPINTVYENRRCVPKVIVPYSAATNGDSAVATADANKGNGDKGGDDIKMTCKTHGLLCTTCKELSICIGDEIGQGDIVYNEIHMMTCKADEVCVPGKGCVSSKDNFCPYRKFECSDMGIYPDPYDCTRYYRCDPTSKKDVKTTPSKCSDGSFNSTSASCGYPMDTTSCLTTPIPICKAIFQMGPVPDNLSIYYICIPDDETRTLAPVLYRCPANKKFDISTLTCT